jgi:putative inorganic carbon (hco3(-)) transporter
LALARSDFDSGPAAIGIAGGVRWAAAVLALLLACLALAALPLEVAAALLVGCAVVVGALIEPTVALAALLLALPVSTLVTVEAGDFSVTAIEPLIALLLLAWLARGFTERDLFLGGEPLLLPLAVLILCVLASSLAAQKLGLAFKEISKWLELGVVFLFTVATLRARGRRQAMLVALFVVGTLEALYGIFQYLTGRGPAEFTVGEALRAYGHFDQPNPFAGYLGTILPLGLALGLGHVFQRRSSLFGALALVAAGCALAGILLSLSRGAWVGVFVALLAMPLAWSRRSRGWLTPALGGLILVVLLTAANILPGGWSDRLVSVAENLGIFDVRTTQVTSENFAVVERMAHWQAGWYMLLDHPLLGVGAGNYPAAYDDYSLPGWNEALGHAHNYYLNMAAETGLPGGLALLALLWTIFRAALQGLHSPTASSETRFLLLGLLGSFSVLVIHNLFDNLLVHGMQVQVGFMLGLLALSAGGQLERASDAGGIADGGPVPSPR